MSLADYLILLRDAGLRTIPGTAAEILDDEVRAVICPDKINTEEWLEAHRTAHSVGLNSNVTIMFGSIEQPRSWARHLVRTRNLQLETGGFTEFVPLPFVHMATPIYIQKKARRGPTFRETVLMIDENISRAAGASHGQMMDADGFRALVSPLGRTLAQRTTLYGRVVHPEGTDSVLAGAR